MQERKYFDPGYPCVEYFRRQRELRSDPPKLAPAGLKMFLAMLRQQRGLPSPVKECEETSIGSGASITDCRGEYRHVGEDDDRARSQSITGTGVYRLRA